MVDVGRKKWHVLQAMYGKALRAEQILGQISIESFVPMESREGRGREVKIVPIISNLIFVYETFTRVREVCAEYSFLYYRTMSHNSCEPMVVPKDQMQRFIDIVTLAQAQGYSDIEYISSESFNISKGERVRITKGVFEGRTGLFVKVEGRSRKQIVVAIGGAVALTIKNPKPWAIVERV